MSAPLPTGASTPALARAQWRPATWARIAARRRRGRSRSRALGAGAAFGGPWRIRHAERRLILVEAINPQRYLWVHPSQSLGYGAPLVFTKLGPATEPGTARHAQRLHGGVVVRVGKKTTGVG